MKKLYLHVIHKLLIKYCCNKKIKLFNIVIIIYYNIIIIRYLKTSVLKRNRMPTRFQVFYRCTGVQILIFY